MSLSKNSDTVHHNSEKMEFFYELDSQRAVLEYRLSEKSGDKDKDKDQVVDFHRTYVPDEFRGRGVARKLVEQGLAWAKEQGFSIETSCWYAELVHKRATTRSA